MWWGSNSSSNAQWAHAGAPVKFSKAGGRGGRVFVRGLFRNTHSIGLPAHVAHVVAQEARGAVLHAAVRAQHRARRARL